MIPKALVGGHLHCAHGEGMGKGNCGQDDHAVLGFQTGQMSLTFFVVLEFFLLLKKRQKQKPG